MNYVPRTVDSLVARLLRAVGAIVLEGPRASGKTATGSFHSESAVRLDIDDDARALAGLNPDLLLAGATPRLIDEWQLEPQLWNRVRHAVDNRQSPGQFILTGSSTPMDDATRHSGAGRFVRVQMRPMTLYESGHSTGQVSLSALLHGAAGVGDRSGLELAGVVERLCVGGWPGLQAAPADEVRAVLRSYVDEVARTDIIAAGDGQVRRDPLRVRRMLTSYARHVATSASAATIATDTAGADGQRLHVDTVRGYLDALARIWVIEEQPSWAPHLRSRDVLRKAAVRHFVDPSLAVAALGASPDRLMRDPNTLGLLFESMAIRDLRVYGQLLDAHVMHYRDSAGSEADAVIQLPDGRYALVEVKLAATHAEAAAQSLGRLAAKIDVGKVGAPAALIVITAGEYAYTRKDGVHVVPLACLGP